MAEQLTPGSKVRLKNYNSKTVYFLLKYYVYLCPKIRILDPHRFNADPDTDLDLAFFIIGDSDPVPDPVF